MSTTSMAIFSNPLFATYSVYARNASFNVLFTFPGPISQLTNLPDKSAQQKVHRQICMWTCLCRPMFLC